MQLEKVAVFSLENALSKIKTLHVHGMPLNISARERWIQIRSMANIHGDEQIMGERLPQVAPPGYARSRSIGNSRLVLIAALGALLTILQREGVLQPTGPAGAITVSAVQEMSLSACLRADVRTMRVRVLKCILSHYT